MTYSRTHRPADRVALIVAVGALHVAAFYAVISGLSVVFVPHNEPPPIRATNSPLPVEPPPPTPRARQTSETLGPVAGPLPLPSPFEPPTFPVIRDPWPASTGAATGTGPGTGTIDPPLPPRPPLVTPRAPRPLGRPGAWVTEADYPTNDIRLGHAGVVGFTLEIAANGRVTGCQIVRSSGFPSLDGLTCALLTRRARFEPATDEQGQTTAGQYSSAVRWQIPD